MLLDFYCLHHIISRDSNSQLNSSIRLVVVIVVAAAAAVAVAVAPAVYT
jgi:hypothetical protein